MDNTKRRELATKIQEVFRNTPHPSEDQIGGYLDALKGYKWDNLPIEVISSYKHDFHRLSAEGFRYFMPALMRAVILQPEEADALVDNIVSLLTPPKDDVLVSKTFEYRIQNLNNQERAMIATFMVSYKDLEPDGAWTNVAKASNMLDGAIEYWSRYLSKD